MVAVVTGVRIGVFVFGGMGVCCGWVSRGWLCVLVSRGWLWLVMGWELAELEAATIRIGM